MPFRDEDDNKDVIRYINAGLNYYPTKEHYVLSYIEEALEIMYKHGSRDATHPFLEQSCIAYMISKINKLNKLPAFIQLQHPDYCVPTLCGFVAEHGMTALHLNSCPMIGHSKQNHFEYEIAKINNYIVN